MKGDSVHEVKGFAEVLFVLLALLGLAKPQPGGFVGFVEVLLRFCCTQKC